MFLSIVIPAHNERSRLSRCIVAVTAYLREQNYEAEVLVVENGSHDGTYELARSLAADHDCLRVFRENRRGKGLAVRRGMLEAGGEYRFICDADLSMPIDQLARFLPPQAPAYDIAIGSRQAPGSVRYHEPTRRHVIGRCFNYMIRLAVLPGLQDTQCGFKCFRGEVAEAIFPLQTLDGLTFDVEVLCIARRRGYRIIEVPIPWYFDSDSRVRLVRDSVRMGLDLFKIRRLARRGAYDAPCSTDATIQTK